MHVQAREGIQRRREALAPRGRENVGELERVGSVLLGGVLLWAGAGRALPSKLLLGAASGTLLYRGVTGHCPLYGALGHDGARHPRTPLLQASESARHGVEEPDPTLTHRSITVGKPAAELFELWRSPAVQTKVMAHFAEVRSEEGGVLDFQVHAPLGQTVHWKLRTVTSVHGSRVLWRSGPEAAVVSEWLTTFRPAARADMGTEIALTLRLDPPGGSVGRSLLRALSMAPGLAIERALRNFKSLVEAGEIPSTEHNPSARVSAGVFGSTPSLES